MPVRWKLKFLGHSPVPTGLLMAVILAVCVLYGGITLLKKGAAVDSVYSVGAGSLDDSPKDIHDVMAKKQKERQHETQLMQRVSYYSNVQGDKEFVGYDFVFE